MHFIILALCCLRYCKSTIFQANHNTQYAPCCWVWVVCDTAKVRFFKQITTNLIGYEIRRQLFAILQKYDFSSKSQPDAGLKTFESGCLRYCKSTIFQANHNDVEFGTIRVELFAILQKYDFSSKSQQPCEVPKMWVRCLRYCKSTIFQANHNKNQSRFIRLKVVCDTAKVRFFKQITTQLLQESCWQPLFAILQKYDFSSKSQLVLQLLMLILVVCDTAKVRFFKQITTGEDEYKIHAVLFAILQKYDFSSKSQPAPIF